MPGLYVAVSGHGFGHSTRTATIVAELQRRIPELAVTIATSTPEWLWQSYLTQPFCYRPCVLDIGVVQSDSLQMDQLATIEKIMALREQSPSLVAREAAYISQHNITLVLADIPVLGIEIAQAAGVPCWMASNFGWDLIYRSWIEDFPAFAEITEWVVAGYQRCDRLFRLPFCESMDAFPIREDVGLTGGTPRFTASQLYDYLHLDRERPVVLLTFGGLSLHAIPYHNVDRFPDIQFLTFDQAAPPFPNLHRLPGHQFRPVDLMVICERLISKPGYSTLAEACRVGVPLVCLTRDRFPEASYLLEGVENYMHHCIITPETFYEGSWDFLRAPMLPPRKSTALPSQGEVTIAQAIGAFLESSR